MSDLIREIIKNQHPTYKELGAAPAGLSATAATAAAKSEWQRNEDRFRAGRHVRDELLRYQWETATGEHYLSRRLVAVCPPLMATTAERFAGLLWENVPPPDFGQLGEVRPEAGRAGRRNKAELVYDAVDGTGYDANGWDAFFRKEMALAMATNWRWHFCEMESIERMERRRLARRSGLRPGTPPMEEDEADGFRPYLVAYSPLAVPDWHYDNGTLQYARIQLAVRNPRVEAGKFVADDEPQHLLLVRSGYDGLGEQFAGGGWWLIDDEGDVIDEPPRQDAAGGWRREGGMIPMWRLVYDEDGGGFSELGNAQVALMNSLADLWHDGHNGAGHGLTAIGVTPESFNAWADQWKEGSRLRALKAQDGVTPSIHDDGAAMVSEAVLAAIREFRSVAEEVMMRELATSPDASGAAKSVEFTQGNSPRLVSMATSIEEDMNLAIHFFHRRWGLEPAGGVTVNKRFDLRSAQTKLAAFFDLMEQRKAHAPTLETEALLDQAERDGLLTGDATRDKVKGELSESLGAAAERVRSEVEANRFFSGIANETPAPGTEPTGTEGDGLPAEVEPPVAE